MTDQALLSDLCSICHINTPKYRCPACSTQTCSLKCVQRHKEWAQCSGKRDRTAYVKKSQLSTPSGIDHDYNFISSIEQSRDRADERLVSKVNQAEDARSAKLNAPTFRNRLQQAGVNVEYAPLGLSRQKLNKTRLAKSKRILWTVEWIHGDQFTTIGEIFDNVSISQNYGPIYLKRGSTTGKKRKRGEGAPANADQPDPGRRTQQSPTKETVPVEGNEESSTLNFQTGVESLLQDESSEKQILEGSVTSLTNSMNQDIPQDGAVSLTLPSGSPDEHGLYYYLVKPKTGGAQTVLIPLSPNDSFLECLRGQTVLEYPTIQVLSQPPDALPENFQTEAEHIVRHQDEANGIERLIAEVESPEMEADDSKPPNHDVNAPNPSAVLATLEQNINS